MTDININERCRETKTRPAKYKGEPDTELVCIDFEGHDGDHLWRGININDGQNPWELSEEDPHHPRIRWKNDINRLHTLNDIINEFSNGPVETEMSKEEIIRGLAVDLNAMIMRAHRAEAALRDNDD